MTRITPEATANFFGRDQLMPFIAQVEDVNDPKGSHRCKVRCVGVHPKDKMGKQGLKTEDLPWARVGYSTQFAQQGRIGAKHGLLPGSWVFGFFLDGDDQQDPMILCSLAATAKSVDKDDREKPKGEDGKLEESDPTFGKVMVSPKTQPNAALRTEDEEGEGYKCKADPSGDVPCFDHDLEAGEQNDGKQAIRARSAKERQDEQESVETPTGQQAKRSQADGRCGTVFHMKEDNKRAREETMPKASSRFKVEDFVWSRYSGKFLNMGKIYQQFALEQAGGVKIATNSKRAADNEKGREMRTMNLEMEVKSKGRDPMPIVKKEKEEKMKNDKKNAIFQTSFIDQLIKLLSQMIKAQDGGGSGGGSGGGGGGGDGGGNSGNPNPVSPTPEDPANDCLVEDFINNINTLTEAALAAANAAAAGGGGGGGSSPAASMLQQVLSLLQKDEEFPLKPKCFNKPEVHHMEKDQSSSNKYKEKACIEDRIYDLMYGSQGNSAGGGGGGSAGAAFSGQTASTPPTNYGSSLVTPLDAEWYGRVYWGGTEKAPDGQYNTIPCEDAIDPEPNPPGSGGEVIALPLPVDIPGVCAQNFANGIANQIIVKRKGKNYFFENLENAALAFPSVFIRGYRGTPIPVVDKESGELVAILTNCSSFDPEDDAPVSIIPDRNPLGITTDDPRYDIQLGGFFIANMGFDYCDPIIEIYDRDKKIIDNAIAKLQVQEGHIIGYEIINKGTGFRRLPDIRIYDPKCPGFGARLYPIMDVVARKDAPPPPEPVNMIFCPANSNYYF